MASGEVDIIGTTSGKDNGIEPASGEEDLKGGATEVGRVSSSEGVGSANISIEGADSKGAVCGGVGECSRVSSLWDDIGATSSGHGSLPSSSSSSFSSCTVLGLNCSSSCSIGGTGSLGEGEGDEERGGDGSEYKTEKLDWGLREQLL